MRRLRVEGRSIYATIILRLATLAQQWRTVSASVVKISVVIWPYELHHPARGYRAAGGDVPQRDRLSVPSVLEKGATKGKGTTPARCVSGASL